MQMKRFVYSSSLIKSSFLQLRYICNYMVDGFRTKSNMNQRMKAHRPHVLSFLFQSKPQLAGDLQAKNLYQVLIGLLVHGKHAITFDQYLIDKFSRPYSAPYFTTKTTICSLIG